MSDANKIIAAFADDNFTVPEAGQFTFQGKFGCRAEHRTARNVITGKKKLAYYVEGSPYQMGYLLGYLAKDEVEKMGTTFIQNAVFDFFQNNEPQNWIVNFLEWLFLVKFFAWLFKKIIQKFLASWIYDFSTDIFKDIPNEYKQELTGLFDGYSTACGGKPKVSPDDLWALNGGTDCLLSFVYMPDVFLERLPKFIPKPKASFFRIPIACNAFSVFNNATGEGIHYFGRDLMFTDAEVFQDTACHVIYHPDDGRLPLVSLTAPGLLGSFTAMNQEGIAMGFNMSPAGNCDHHRPGFNSLLLVRDSVHRGTDAQAALDNVIQAQRGVSWNYMIADGKNNQSVVVEAGMNTANLDFITYPPDDIQQYGLLPDQRFLNTFENQTPQRGLMVRWHNYQYPKEFLKFNKGLFEYYGKDYDESLFGERGYICRRINGQIEDNCPYSFYFAPQREDKDDVLIMTNHFITPSIRFCGMDSWVTTVAKGWLTDIQWRYDKLNDLLLENYGRIDWNLAWELINFLAPDSSYVPDYYADHQDYQYHHNGKTYQTKQIQASTSLCNLTAKVIKSRYGYYADEAICTTLLNFVD